MLQSIRASEIQRVQQISPRVQELPQCARQNVPGPFVRDSGSGRDRRIVVDDQIIGLGLQRSPTQPHHGDIAKR